jgi:hypothetical protein
MTWLVVAGLLAIVLWCWREIAFIEQREAERRARWNRLADALDAKAGGLTDADIDWAIHGPSAEEYHGRDKAA